MKENEFRNMVLWTLIILTLAYAVVVLNSCKSTKYVPINNTHKDSLYQSSLTFDSTKWFKEIHDTVFQFKYDYRDTIIHDSVYVLEKADGSKDTYREKAEKIILRQIDSVYNKKYVEGIIERYNAKIDSLSHITQDTIQVPVERELTKSQKSFILLGKIFSAILVILLIASGYIVYKKVT